MATLEDSLPPGHWDTTDRDFSQRCLDADQNGEEPQTGTPQCQSCSQHSARVEASIAAIPLDRLWRTPVADGNAHYYLSSRDPLVLRHIPYQDRYTAHPAMIRGITLPEITEDQREIGIERKIAERQKRIDEQNPCLTPFDLKHFTSRAPFHSHWTYQFTDFPQGRCLNMLIKPRAQFELLIPTPMAALRDMVTDTINLAIRAGVDPMDRYIYLTVDQRDLKKGETLRTPGWHSDGFQGNEVPRKQPGDYQAVWSEVPGTQYADQSFNVDGLDPSVHNIFAHLGLQVRPENIHTMPANILHTHGPYLVHRSPPAHQDCYRRFVRISITHVPVTSRTMTINPLIRYDYPVHTTNGKIPPNLR